VEIVFKANLFSTITCPKCGYAEKVEMPTHSCQYFYDCKACKAVLKAKSGDCCVFCSYADIPCPSIQEIRNSKENLALKK